MSHTMSDRIPAVAAALEELIKDNGILVLANALRSLGWEGKDIDQIVEHSVMEEIRDNPTLLSEGKPVEDVDALLESLIDSPIEVEMIEDAEMLEGVEMLEGIDTSVEDRQYVLSYERDRETGWSGQATLTMTPPPEWNNWGASYSGMYFNDDGQAFDGEGRLIISIIPRKKK